MDARVPNGECGVLGLRWAPTVCVLIMAESRTVAAKRSPPESGNRVGHADEASRAGGLPESAADLLGSEGLPGGRPRARCPALRFREPAEYDKRCCWKRRKKSGEEENQRNGSQDANSATDDAYKCRSTNHLTVFAQDIEPSSRPQAPPKRSNPTQVFSVYPAAAFGPRVHCSRQRL